MAKKPMRVLPALSERSGPFWTGGEKGELRFLHCEQCGTIVHPPTPLCPQDHSKRLSWKPVSGRARVATFTVNHQPWLPGLEIPYVVAIIEIEEQPSVRLMTNVVNCAPEAVRIGMPVRAVFEHHRDDEGDVWVPLFEPDPGREG